jgi:hypothetical protein
MKFIHLLVVLLFAVLTMSEALSELSCLPLSRLTRFFIPSRGHAGRPIPVAVLPVVVPVHVWRRPVIVKPIIVRRPVLLPVVPYGK